MPSLDDIKELLSSPCLITQAQGFSHLIAILKSNDMRNRDWEPAKHVFWKVFIDGPSEQSGWASATTGGLLTRGILTEKDLCNECLIALPSSPNAVRVASLLVRLVPHRLRDVLSAVGRSNERQREEIVAHLKHVPLSKSFPCIARLLLGSELSAPLKTNLAFHVLREGSCEQIDMLMRAEVFASTELVALAADSPLRNTTVLRSPEKFSLDFLEKIDLSVTGCVFPLCAQLARGGFEHSLAVLRNPTLPVHPALRAPLTLLAACFPDSGQRGLGIGAVLPEDASESVKRRLVEVNASRMPKFLDNLGRVSLSLEEYLAWICESELRRKYFFEIWLGEFESWQLLFHLHLLASLVAELSTDTEFDACLRLIVDIASASAAHVSEILVFLLPLFAVRKSSQDVILKHIASLGTNKVVCVRVLTFLLAVSQQRSLSWALRRRAIELIADVWECHDSTFDHLKPLWTIRPQSDTVEMQHAKMYFVQRVCKKYNCEKGEELIPMLNGLVNEGGPLFADALVAIKDLCETEHMEVDAVISLLRAKVQKFGNDSVLCAFCELLAVASKTSEDEETPDDEDSLARSIRELWAMSSHSSTAVRCAAWKALASFPLKDVIAATFGDSEESAPSFVSKLMEYADTVNDSALATEYGKFVHKMVGCEVEELGRDMYTCVRSPPSDLLLLSSYAKEYIANDSFEALSMLAFLSSTIQIPIKKAQFVMARIYQFLLKVTPMIGEVWRPTFEYFAAWKMALNVACEALRESKGPQASFAWIRDSICETLKRALSQSNTAQANVITALAFLAEMESCDRKWLTSVAEYLLLCGNSNHKCRAYPLFQHAIVYSEYSVALARFLFAKLLRKLPVEVSSAFESVPSLSDENIPDIPKWLRDLSDSFIIKDYVPTVDDGIAYLVSALLELRPSKLEALLERCAFGISEVRLAGFVFDADSTVVDFITDRLPVDSASEEIFLELLSKKNDAIGAKEVFNLYELFADLCENEKRKYVNRLSQKVKHVVTSEGRQSNVRQALLKGLAHCQACQCSLVRAILPTSYSRLSKSSLLRAIVDAIISNRWSSNPQLTEAMWMALVGHRRSDGRYLPPLDWNFLASPCYSALCVSACAIACQESDVKALLRIVYSFCSSEFSTSLAALFASRGTDFFNLLPASHVPFFADLMFAAAKRSNFAEEILKGLAQALTTQLPVVQSWAAMLPALKEARTITHPLFVLFAAVDVPQSLCDSNRLVSLWALSKSSSTIQLSPIIEIMLNIELAKRPTALLILTYHLLRVDIQRRVDLILDLVTLCRVNCLSVRESSHISEVLVYWDVFVALCVSEKLSELPLSLFTDDDPMAWRLVELRLVDHFEILIGIDCFAESVTKILNLPIDVVRALRESSDEDSRRAISICREILRISLCVRPSIVIPIVEETSLWDELFSPAGIAQSLEAGKTFED